MKNYTTQQALAVLAAAPDEVANNLGFWRDSAGKLGRAITREEARQGLLDGLTDPTAFVRNLRLIAFVQRPGALEERLTGADEHRAAKRRETFRLFGKEEGMDVVAGHEVGDDGAVPQE